MFRVFAEKRIDGQIKDSFLMFEEEILTNDEIDFLRGRPIAGNVDWRAYVYRWDDSEFAWLEV